VGKTPQEKGEKRDKKKKGGGLGKGFSTGHVQDVVKGRKPRKKRGWGSETGVGGRVRRQADTSALER